MPKGLPLEGACANKDNQVVQVEGALKVAEITFLTTAATSFRAPKP